jgi:hypothetical protein
VCKKKGREGHLAEKSQMIIIPSKSAFAFWNLRFIHFFAMGNK